MSCKVKLILVLRARGGIIQGERQHEYTNETSGGLFGLVLKKR